MSASTTRLGMPSGVAVLDGLLNETLGLAVEARSYVMGSRQPLPSAVGGPVAPLVEAWGLRRGGRTPSAEEVAAARERVDWRGLALDDGRAVRRDDVRVEEGGFGKGAALDEALVLARAVAPRAEVALDFGGQLAWTGGSGRG